jgi:hypothetical protein
MATICSSVKRLFLSLEEPAFQKFLARKSRAGHASRIDTLL